MSFTKEKSKKPLKKETIKTLQFTFKGISLTTNKKQFRAVVYVNKRRFDLGAFNTERQAIKAYDRLKRKYERIFNEKS